MRGRIFFGSIAALAALLAVQSPAGAQVASSYHLSGPTVHDNVAVYFVHGKSDGARAPLTFERAAATGTARIYRTKSNKCMADNFSSQELFIQAGTLLRGATQDQVVAFSYVVPPKSTAFPLDDVFCVERGRSVPRGSEDSMIFSTVAALLPPGIAQRSVPSETSRSELAVLTRQFGVWLGIESLVSRVSEQLGVSIASERSPSSLPLALEHVRLAQAQAPYVAALQLAGEGADDIVGAVVAINGRLAKADIYASNELFRQMWPKLLGSYAIEGIATQQATPDSLPSSDRAAEFLAQTESRTAASARAVHRSHVASVIIDAAPLDRAVPTLLATATLGAAAARNLTDEQVLARLLEIVPEHDLGPAVRQAIRAGLLDRRPYVRQAVEQAETAGRLRHVRDFEEVVARSIADHAAAGLRTGLVPAPQDQVDRGAQAGREVSPLLPLAVLLLAIWAFIVAKGRRAPQSFVIAGRLVRPASGTLWRWRLYARWAIARRLAPAAVVKRMPKQAQTA
jgi:hypothetical protein